MVRCVVCGVVQVHQLKRLGSSSFLVTTHGGQFYPNLFTDPVAVPVRVPGSGSSPAPPAELKKVSADGSAPQILVSDDEIVKFDRSISAHDCALAL